MKSILWAAFLCLFLHQTACLAGNPMNAPFSTQSPTPRNTYETSSVNFLMSGLIQLYSSVISPADGPRSPSYPTGSAYGKLAVEKYGFIPGLFLITDRFLHESDINLGPVITIYGTDRYFDPVANNTYWWDEEILEDNLQ